LTASESDDISNRHIYMCHQAMRRRGSGGGGSSPDGRDPGDRDDDSHPEAGWDDLKERELVDLNLLNSVVVFSTDYRFRKLVEITVKVCLE
jgi:hypothetical protein